MGGTFDGVGRDAVLHRHGRHVGVWENFQDMQIGKIHPSQPFEKVQSHRRLDFGLGGKAVHGEELDDHMGMCAANIIHIFAQCVEVQVLFDQFLQPRRRGLESHTQPHGAGLDHQIDIVFGQQVAAQAVGEEKMHIQSIVDDQLKKLATVLFVQIKNVIHKHKPPESHPVIGLHFGEDMPRRPDHMPFGPDFMAIETLVGTPPGGLNGDRMLHHGETDPAPVFLVIHQRPVRQRQR